MDSEKQIVRICIDRSRSHTAGIMPYIPYNTEVADIKYVSMDEQGGNWGQFPLDLVVMNENIETGIGGLNVKVHRFKDGESGCRHTSSVNRLRYAELARRYYEIQEMLNKGIFTRAGTRCKRDESQKLICEPCVDLPERDFVCDLVLSENFNRVESAKYDLFGTGIPMPIAYSFKPLPRDGFQNEGSGIYTELRNFDLQEGEYYVLIDDYAKYAQYEEAWKTWWGHNGIDSSSSFPVEEGDFQFCRAFETYFIGKVEVPDDITGVKVPQYVYYSDIERYKDWFEKNGMTNEDSIIGKPEDIRKAFDDKGGLAFYRFLTSLGNTAPWITAVPKVGSTYGVSFAVPYISVPISLEDNHEYGGLYESYLYSYSEKDEEFYDAYSEFSGYGDTIETWYVPDTDIYVDSQLSAVIDADATEIEDITGTWGTFNNGSAMFSCTFRSGKEGSGERSVDEVRISETEYGHWDCSMVSSDGIECGDGENLSSGERKYRTVTILECIRDIVLNPGFGETYYFLVKKDNCEAVPFRAPYTVNSFHNMTETNDPNVFTGDYVTSIETTDTTWKIQYVIGGDARSLDGGVTFRAIPNTGIKYEEEYDYKPCQTMRTCIDGHDNLRVYYDKITMKEAEQEVYSEEYRLTRKTNVAKIIGMKVGSIMAGDTKRMISAMAFTRDGSESLPSETKNTFDVIIDRGFAAAFERHFKLSECNTFEDLKNYGNNFYKL